MPDLAHTRGDGPEVGGDAETEREALRRVMPPPEDDAADALNDALAHARFRAERFGKHVDVKVDRYIVRRELGRGGMGVVFEAYDPVLLVPVALKVLRRSGGHTGAGESDMSLQREAQALARVEGDHVVRVYSAGFYLRQPWIAMQFVAGPDLHTWLRYRRERGEIGVGEVVARFVDAARGLASIHLAGLVHRDFKPQNAVVDPRGRVRVLDFGLAAADRRPLAGVAVGPLRGPIAGLSSTGALVGTSRYASPEQFVGANLDHRSDQFSFCVALYEALWGTTPFGTAVSTGQRLAAEPTARAPQPPHSDAPGWLVAAVLRGLARDPADRFPDMAALIHELTRDRRRGYRRIALVLGGVLLGALGVAAGLAPPDRAAICAARVDAIDALWQPDQVPAWVVGVIERHVRAWKLAVRHACADTYTHARAPENLLARRQECLDGARARFAALLARAREPEAADRWIQAFAELPPPANCLDEGLGRVAAPRDPHTRARVREVDAVLAEALAERVLGDEHEAAESARHALALAVTSGHRAARARARAVLGELERLRGRDGAAAAALAVASAEAGVVHDLPLQIHVEHELVRLALLSGHTPERAEEHLERAAAGLDALGPDVSRSPRLGAGSLRAEHADMRGLVHYHRRRYAEAVASHTEALQRWTVLAQEADLRREIAASLLNRGRAYSDDQQPAAALADYREALRRETELYGADHPSLALVHYNIAVELRGLADLDPALEAARRSLELDRSHRGSRSAPVAADHTLLAVIHQDRGELGLARDHAQAAIWAHAGSGGSAEARADAEFALAGIAFLQEASDAGPLLRRAAAAYRRIPGPEAACQQALVHVYHGVFAEQQDRFDDAENEAATAADALARVSGGPCEAHGQLLWLRGRLAERRGRLTEAVTQFSAALAATAVSAPARADVLVDLATALRALGSDPGRVVALVRAAQVTYRARGLEERVRALEELLAQPTRTRP